MKKTNEKGKLLNLFRTKKFVNEKYEEDKQLIIDKYNELGYRDAKRVRHILDVELADTLKAHVLHADGTSHVKFFFSIIEEIEDPAVL